MTSHFDFIEEYFQKADLLPAIVQEAGTNEVLMLAYMNRESMRKTFETGYTWFYSRSRQELWNKGATSGHLQRIIDIKGDCDKDTLLVIVEQTGPACHTGSHSCFFNEDLADLDKPAHDPGRVLEADYRTIVDRRDHPREGSYTNYLFDKGLDKMLKKLGEENTEIIIAAKNPNPTEMVYEIADYLYHLMVVMACKGLDWEDIMEELARRQAT